MINNAIKFYYNATQLKDILRQGAVQWHVDKKRLESIAEHIYGTLILAIGMQSELNLQLDMEKVMKMLTIHELEEIIIGDFTPLDNISSEEKIKMGKKAVKKITESLQMQDELIAITDEFNECKTKEAKFCIAMDKLECVLEFKKYVDLGQTSLKKITPQMLENKYLKAYVDSGKYDLADIFFLYHMPAYKEFGIDEKYWFNNLKKIEMCDTEKNILQK